MDDGLASFLISLFQCGDLAGVGVDLGLADVGIKSLMFGEITNKPTCALAHLHFSYSWFKT